MNFYFKHTNINEPISIDDAKTLLGIDFEWKDDEICQLITAAREHVESYTELSISEKILVLMLDDVFNEISVPFPPLVALMKATAFDSGGKVYNIDVKNFNIYKQGQANGIIETKDMNVFPRNLRSRQGIELEINVGYKKEECPAAFKDAMNLYIQNTYDRIPFDEWKNSFYSLLQKWRKLNL